MRAPTLWPASRSPAATTTALMLALAGPPALALWSRRAYGLAPSLSVQLLLQLVLCLLAAWVMWVVCRHERLPLASIGLRRPDVLTPVVALALILVVRFGLPVVTERLLRLLDVGGFETGLAEIARQPIWWRVLVALTSGPVEEVLYRGYAVERLATLSGRLPIGGLLAAVAFGAAHAPFWGLGPALAADLPFGVLMVAAYAWRRDLVATSAAHTVLLLVGLLNV